MKFEIEPDIRHASTIASAFYTDPRVFAESAEKIFVPSWQFVCSADQVKVPGSVFPFVMLDGFLEEPLLLVRDLDDRLRCMSNVCTHRGNLVCEGAGVEKSLRCRYHGRRFDLTGRCTFMPEFEEVAGYPCPNDDLPNVEIGQWGPWIFASIRPKVTFEEWLRPIKERVGWLPVQDFTFTPERARQYTVRAHWALYLDNYLEGFHIPYIHAALNAVLDYGSYETQLHPHGNLQFGPAADGEPAFDLPPSSPDYGTRVAAYYYWQFPNFMFNFYPWGCSLNVVRPVRHDLTKVEFLPYVWKPELLGQGAGGDLDRVEREDEVVVELVQRGVRSRLYDKGRYSVKRENGVHQFHQLIAQSMSS